MLGRASRRRPPYDEPMSIDFQQRTLDSGLTVVAEINPDAHTSAVGFFVKTGARDEVPGVMGVSHFLEHMMFKGTARRTAEMVNREFDDMGANYNAYTSHEQTVYYAQVLPEFLPRAVDLLGDILRPALRTDDFDMEKNVILEEIGMYDDRPTWRLQDTLLEKYFTDHPLGFRVLGTPDTVGALTADQMRAYFENRYAADNIVVAAAGKVDFGALMDDVTKVTGDWRPSGATRDHGEPMPDTIDLTLTDAKVNRHYLAIMTPGPSAQDEQRYAAKVLSDVLGDSEGSRIYWALVDPGLADEADFSFLPYDQTGAYFAYASCDPARAEQVETKLIETIEAIKNGVEPDEIERARNKLATSATVSGERPLGRMRSIGGQWTYLGEYLPLEEELARLTAVTRDDLAALLDQHPFTPRTIVRLTPS